MFSPLSNLMCGVIFAPEKYELVLVVVLRVLPWKVRVNPDPNGLPGGPQIQQILNGLSGWALLAALGGLLISVMVWSLGSFGGNYHAVSRGKTGVLVCGGAAMVAGGAAPIINFFATLGSQIR